MWSPASIRASQMARLAIGLVFKNLSNNKLNEQIHSGHQYGLFSLWGHARSGPQRGLLNAEVGRSCDYFSSFSSETPIQKVACLGCSFINAKSQLGGVPFELSDLSLAVLGLVDFGALVHVFDAVAEHAVDQSRQLGGHGFDRNGGAELGPESAKLRSQIGVA